MLAQDLLVIMGTVLAAAIRMMDASFGRCPEGDCHFQCSDRKVTLHPIADGTTNDTA